MIDPEAKTRFAELCQRDPSFSWTGFEARQPSNRRKRPSATIIGSENASLIMIQAHTNRARTPVIAPKPIPAP